MLFFTLNVFWWTIYGQFWRRCCSLLLWMWKLLIILAFHISECFITLQYGQPAALSHFRTHAAVFIHVLFNSSLNRLEGCKSITLALNLKKLTANGTTVIKQVAPVKRQWQWGLIVILKRYTPQLVQRVVLYPGWGYRSPSHSVQADRNEHNSSCTSSYIHKSYAKTWSFYLFWYQPFTSKSVN